MYWVLGTLALAHFVWKWSNNDWTIDPLILFTLSDTFIFFTWFIIFTYIQPRFPSKHIYWIYTLMFIWMLLTLISSILLNKNSPIFWTFIFWLFPIAILVFSLRVLKQHKADHTPDNDSFITKRAGS